MIKVVGSIKKQNNYYRPAEIGYYVITVSSKCIELPAGLTVVNVSHLRDDS